MTEKVHWKTAQKLAKEWSIDSIPNAPEVEQAYNIYDSRASLVAYAKNEKEANEELAKFPNWFKKLI